jgi:sugar O-acyltransferase (sialic acid O-acetyltransferase NeuD family)
VKLAILGAGGLGRVVAESIVRTGLHDVAGFIDDSDSAPSEVMGLPLLGSSDDLPEIASQTGITGAVVAIGNNLVRERLAQEVLAAGLALPAIIDAAATVSPSALVGDGAVVSAAAVIGPGTTVGRLTIINTAAIVEHDATLGEASYVGPRCLVDARARVGPGACVERGVTVDKDEEFGFDPANG